MALEGDITHEHNLTPKNATKLTDENAMCMMSLDLASSLML